MNIRTLLSAGSLAASVVIPSVAHAWPHQGGQFQAQVGYTPQADCPRHNGNAQAPAVVPVPQAAYVPVPQAAYAPVPQPAYVPVPQAAYAPVQPQPVYVPVQQAQGNPQRWQMEALRRAEMMRHAQMRQFRTWRHGADPRFNGR